MIVFKSYLRLIKRYYKNILVYLIIFIAISMTFTITSSNPSNLKKLEINIALIDNAEDDLSKVIKNHLSEKGNVFIVDKKDSNLKMDIYINKYSLAVNIKENALSLLKQGKEAVEIVSANESFTSYYIKNDIEKILKFSKFALDNNKSISNIEKILEKETKVEFIGRSGEDEAKNEWLMYYFRASHYIVAMIILSVIGFINYMYYEENLYKRTNISPITNRSFIMQLFLANILFVVFLVALLAIFPITNIGFGIVDKKYLLALFNIFLFGLSMSSTVSLITSFAIKKEFISMFSNIASLSMAFLSGVFVPIEFMPKGVVNFARFFPMYHSSIANTKIFKSSLGLELDMLIQVSFSILFILLSIFIRKNRKAKN